MLTTLLAWLSRLLIEDPARTARFLTRRGSVWIYAVAASTTGLVLAINAGGATHVRQEIKKAQLTSEAALASTPRCFGAASRDPDVPCKNPKLRLTVIPRPVAAESAPNPGCRRLGSIDGKQVCEFGVKAADATTTVALVGDSHAGMWRVALDPVARRLGWHGVHMGHASCPLSTAMRDLVEPNRSHCIKWKRHVFEWFERHPEASTLIVSQLTGGSGVVPSGGRSAYATAIAGYVGAWKALPPSVKHVIVLRDPPKAKSRTAACIERAIDRRVAAGTACAVRRGDALDPDPAVDAARRIKVPSVAVVDLTRVFCDRSRCFPVIGGALVYRDTTHMMPGFGRSLAPLVQRRLDAIIAGWSRAA